MIAAAEAFQGVVSLGNLLTITVVLVAGWGYLRRGSNRIATEASAAWKSVAEAAEKKSQQQDEQITALQTENKDLHHRIGELEARPVELEAIVKGLQNLASVVATVAGSNAAQASIMQTMQKSQETMQHSQETTTTLLGHFVEVQGLISDGVGKLLQARPPDARTRADDQA